MPRLNPLSKKKFIKRVKNLGLEVDPSKGRGGEWVVYDPDNREFLPLPHLSPGEDVKVPYILATLRIFNITREQWIEAAKRKIKRS